MTGDSAGHVKFFDTDFKLLNWLVNRSNRFGYISNPILQV